MALRTKEEIYAQMESVKIAEPTLNAVLTSLSKTAIWRLILTVVTEGIYYFESLFEKFKTEVDEKAREAQVGNAQWYRRQILAFQYGDTLVLEGDIYRYNTDNPLKRIIARCAVEEMPNSTIRIKIAKSNGSGGLIALTNPEIDALISYVKKVRFAGTRFQVFTNNGDQLRIYLNVYYDPIVPLTTVMSGVENTINQYIANLPFNGELNVTKLIDEIQKIVGVTDVEFTSGASRFSISDPYTAFTRSTIAVGGYFKISTNMGETLNDTITYISLL